jgi:hypothetical protein
MRSLRSVAIRQSVSQLPAVCYELFILCRYGYILLYCRSVGALLATVSWLECLRSGRARARQYAPLQRRRCVDTHCLRGRSSRRVRL